MLRIDFSDNVVVIRTKRFNQRKGKMIHNIITEIILKDLTKITEVALSVDLSADDLHKILQYKNNIVKEMYKIQDILYTNQQQA